MSASTLIADAMADLAGSDLFVDALYFPAGGSPYLIRACRRVPDDTGASLLMTGANVEGVLIKVLASAIPEVSRGDKIALTYPDDPSLWPDPVFWAGETVATIRKSMPDRSRLFKLLSLDKDIS